MSPGSVIPRHELLISSGATPLQVRALLGGLASSTAVTAAMATQARTSAALRRPCAFATLRAKATMCVRVFVVVAVLDRALMLQLLWPVGTMAAPALMGAVLLGWRAVSGLADVDPITLSNAEETGKGQLRLQRPWRDGTTHLVFDPVDFLARRTPHPATARPPGRGARHPGSAREAPLAGGAS